MTKNILTFDMFWLSHRLSSQCQRPCNYADRLSIGQLIQTFSKNNFKSYGSEIHKVSKWSKMALQKRSGCISFIVGLLTDQYYYCYWLRVWQLKCVRHDILWSSKKWGNYVYIVLDNVLQMCLLKLMSIYVPMFLR